MRVLLIIVYAGLALVSLGTDAEAQTSDNLALRQKEVQALRSENAALRQRLDRLEQGSSNPSASGLNTNTKQQTSAAMAAEPVYMESSLVTATLPYAPYEWTGFYVGGFTGYGDRWSSGSIALSASGSATGDIVDLILADPVHRAALASIPSAVELDPDGLIAGGQIGYDHQVGRIVLGAEADFFAAGIEGRESKSQTQALVDPVTTVVGTVRSDVSAQQKLEWFSTVRGRLGYTLIDTLLLYATGGFALGEASSSVIVSQAGCAELIGVDPRLCFTGSANGRASEVLTGWTVGAGAEYAFAANWSFRGEFLHYDLGDLSYRVAPVTLPVDFNPGAPQGASTVSVKARSEFEGDIIRAGITYRFP